ncbi:hypothetical protein RI367_000260 [Sorochytrium milnesiophthora]
MVHRFLARPLMASAHRLATAPALRVSTLTSFGAPLRMVRAGKHTLAKEDAELIAASTATAASESSAVLDVSPAAGSVVVQEQRHAADIRRFLSRFRTDVDGSATSMVAAAAGGGGGGQEAVEHALMPSDHPLLMDDFSQLPPFQAPRSASLHSQLPVSSAQAGNVPAAHFGHVNMPYMLTGQNPLLPPQMVVGNSALLVPANASKGTTEQLIAQLFERAVQYTEPPSASANAMHMTSVLRKRRKKMNKHKLKKRRKATRSQRRK